MTPPLKTDLQINPRVDTKLNNNVVCSSCNRNTSVVSGDRKSVYRTKCFYSKHHDPQDIKTQALLSLI